MTAVVPTGSAATGSRPAATKLPARTGRRKRGWHYGFALPSVVLIAFFFGLPLVANIVFAFLRWTGYSSNITWTGLGNFQQLAALGTLTHAIRVTITYAIISGLVQNISGLALAKAMCQGGRADTFFRSIFFIPVLFSPLAAGYIWKAALQPDGPINHFLSVFVPGGVEFAWLGDATTAIIAVASVDGWKWSGLVTMVYIAGLRRIPQQVLDAARVDGAGGWSRFWRVEIPLLAPAFSYNLVVTVVGALSAIDVAFAMTNGGPGTATSVLNVEMYRQYAGAMFGTASALGLTITVLCVITAIPMLRYMLTRDVEI